MDKAQAPYKSKDWLVGVYCEQKLSMVEIARRFGISKNTLPKYLAKFNIPKRTLSEAMHVCTPDRLYRDRRWLRKMYVRKKFSINELSRLCHCDPKVIRAWLKKHGIESRTMQGAYQVRRKASLWKWYGSYWNRILLIGRDLAKSFKRYF